MKGMICDDWETEGRATSRDVRRLIAWYYGTVRAIRWSALPNPVDLTKMPRCRHRRRLDMFCLTCANADRKKKG